MKQKLKPFEVNLITKAVQKSDLSCMLVRDVARSIL